VEVLTRGGNRRPGKGAARAEKQTAERRGTRDLSKKKKLGRLRKSQRKSYRENCSRGKRPREEVTRGIRIGEWGGLKEAKNRGDG